jgi:hypothetical protein
VEEEWGRVVERERMEEQVAGGRRRRSRRRRKTRRRKTRRKTRMR